MITIKLKPKLVKLPFEITWFIITSIESKHKAS